MKRASTPDPISWHTWVMRRVLTILVLAGLVCSAPLGCGEPKSDVGEAEGDGDGDGTVETGGSSTAC